MIATAPAPVAARDDEARTALEILLLGDLRGLLQEPSGPQRDRWLLATLDMLLLSRPRSSSVIYLPTLASTGRESHSAQRFTDLVSIPFDKLQRLRDRIVHRAPCAALIQELQDELRGWFVQLRSQAPASPLDCGE